MINFLGVRGKTLTDLSGKRLTLSEKVEDLSVTPVGKQGLEQVR